MALLLLSTTTAATPGLVTSLQLLLLGIGIGLVLQVLGLVVQNAVPHALVGTATAGHSFFREIGASAGTAVVGSVFTARLAAGLAGSGVDASDLTPGGAAQLPDALRSAVADAHAGALAPVLGWLAPLFVVGLVLVALLPDTPLRTTNDRTPAPSTP